MLVLTTSSILIIIFPPPTLLSDLLVLTFEFCNYELYDDIFEYGPTTSSFCLCPLFRAEG
jgi:hypothetical protein